MGTNKKTERATKVTSRHLPSSITKQQIMEDCLRVGLLDKLTREARGVAFSASAELDAPCCHPRLLRRKLQSLELWTPSSVPMLDLFCEKYADWRQVLARYLEVPLEKAKTELIRIFYGGSLSCDIPWLRKLGAEVQRAAGLILSHPSSAQWKNTYSRRPNPEFSLLCAVLSFAENEPMDLIKQDSNLKMDVAIFDGAIVRCDTLADDIAIKEACATFKPCSFFKSCMR